MAHAGLGTPRGYAMVIIKDVARSDCYVLCCFFRVSIPQSVTGGDIINTVTIGNRNRILFSFVNTDCYNIIVY